MADKQTFEMKSMLAAVLVGPYSDVWRLLSRSVHMHGKDTSQNSHPGQSQNSQCVWLDPIMHIQLCVYQHMSLQQVQAHKYTAQSYEFVQRNWSH